MLDLDDLDVPTIEEAIGIPFARWAHQCHLISLKIVQARLFPVARVARGATPGVMSQHSWVVLGEDCYDPSADVFDATLWSYVPDVEGIWTGTAYQRPHRPHGWGSAYDVAMPAAGEGPVIELEPVGGWSREAAEFLADLGPLDIRGWGGVAHLPVFGWPAAEIIGAMYDDDRVRVLIPIDIAGMLTDRNPGGLYLPVEPDGDGS
jgi:hypothetical protein